jgi:hypothetical protein
MVLLLKLKFASVKKLKTSLWVFTRYDFIFPEISSSKFLMHIDKKKKIVM